MEASSKRGFDLAPRGAVETLPELLTSVQNNLQESLAEIDDRLVSRRQIARRIEALLRDLMRREIKSVDLRSELDVFLAHMHAGEAVSKIAGRLMQYVDATVYEDAASTDHGVVYARQVALDLQDFVDWYTRRRTTLEAFHSSDSGDALAKVRVVHDKVLSGLRGMEVLGALKLHGHFGKTLWLRARILGKSGVVSVREGWETWTDDSGRLAIAGAEGQREFVVMQPIQPAGQLCMIDQLRLFIPYSALQLASGTHEVRIEVTLGDARGAELLREVVEERIAVPPLELCDDPIPSPHVLALWRSDSAEGDSILNLKAVTGVIDGLNTDGQVLRVSFDLRLFNREGVAVRTECRVMNKAGDTLVGGEGDSGLSLFPQRPIARYFDLEFVIPTGQLGLSKGRHDLLCELVVLAENGQAICGALQPVRIEVASDQPLPTELGIVRALPEDPSLGVQCTGISVTTLTAFGDEHSVRVVASLASSDWTHRFMLVRMSIEDDRGQVIGHRRENCAQLVRGLYVGGAFGGEVRTIINNFDIADFAVPEVDGLTKDVGFRARVRIYNGDGQQVLEASKTFRLGSAVFPREVRAPVPLEGLHIADLNLRRIVGDEASIAFSVAINAKLGGADSGIGTLYLELVDDSQVIEVAGEAAALPGRVIPLDLSSVRCSPGFKSGWYQTSFETVLQVSGSSRRSVKAMLFSPNGKLLQSIRQVVDDGVFGSDGSTEGRSSSTLNEVTPKDAAAVRETPPGPGSVKAEETAQQVERNVKADLFSGSVAAVLSYRIGVAGLPSGGCSLTIRFMDSDGRVIEDRESSLGLRVYDGLHEFIEVGSLEFVRAVVLTGRESELSGKLRVALNRFKLKAGDQVVQADIRLLGTRGEVVFSELRKFKCRIPGSSDGLISRLVKWISGR